MDFEHWLALFATCVALAVSPGPSSTYALSTSIRYGHRAGVRAVIGSATGFASLIFIALVGLTALVATLPWFILGLKIAGAIYLLWLAVSLWRHAKFHNEPATDINQWNSTKKQASTLVRGFLIAFSNPKVVLFWLAFIPSILLVEQLDAWDIVIVIATFALVEAIAELLLVWLGARAQRYLQKHMALIDRLSAVIFSIFAMILLTT